MSISRPHTRLNRRRFLAVAPLAVLSRAIGQPAPEPSQAKVERTDLLVVGAGISGLAVARAAANKGLKVIVLEARDRIGGRIFTDYSLGWPLDLGASWIHGVSGNPITQLARDFRLDLLPTNTNNHWRFRSNGTVSRSDAELDTQFDGLMTNVDLLRGQRQDNGRPDVSVQQGIDAAMSNKPLDDALSYAINSNIEHAYGADASQLSLYHYDQGGSFGGADVIFPRGYGQIAANLALGQDVRMGQVVQRIDYSGRTVRITSSRGDFEAPRAVVTLPLGVLKSNTVTFNPGLPAKKLQAIRQLGSGALNKCFLRFPKAFWPKEPDLIGYISNRKGEWAEWLNVQRYLGEPILMGFNAGTFGAQVEKLSNPDVTASAMRALRDMFGSGIPDPTTSLMTRWGSDPFARGTFSYAAVNATGDEYDALAEPINARLYFAGEATHRDYPATVHGAYLSGLREAERILMP